MRRLLLILFPLFLAACVAPAPRGTPPRPQGDGEVPNSAVVALQAEADRQEAAGNLPLAASALERALRITPRDPGLRIELAELRMAQGDPFQAKELGRMAVVYAGDDEDVQADAWQVIADAEHAIGNQVEAQLAEQEVARLRGE